MVKKRKNKKKQEISDYGAQQLIRIDKKIIRLVDKAEFRLAFSKANGGRRIEKVNNSVLENYYHRNLLDIKDRDYNSRRFIAGSKFEITGYHAGLQPTITMRYKDRSTGTMQEFQSHQLDSLNKFRKVNKYLGNLSDIAWYVIIDNKAARKRMDEFRECLDKLIEYYKV
jgi:hypothetical protein